MGSTTSGRLTDYPGSGSKGGGGSGGSGGSSGSDRCDRAFTCNLEEVEQCEYFTSNQSAPPVGLPLLLELDGRIFAVAPNGQKVGALPTRLNYLADCLASGFTYTGTVSTSSSTGKLVMVGVDFIPHQQ